MTDWDHRQLCSNGACVGLIGDDGTCKVCGRAAENWGDERRRGLVSTASAEDETVDEDDDDDDDEEGDGEDDGGADGDDDDDDDEDEEDDDDDDGEGGDDAGVIEASAGGARDAPGEWSKRTLCPDGGCVGVIGDDRKCKACGKAAA